jgi:hypothetical protein
LSHGVSRNVNSLTAKPFSLREEEGDFEMGSNGPDYGKQFSAAADGGNN